MFIIWRGAGWLTLVFILLAVGLSTGVLEPIYRSNTGFEFVYNAEKGVIGGIGMIVTAIIFWLFVQFVLPWIEAIFGPDPIKVEPADPATQADPSAAPAPAPLKRKPFWKTKSSTFFIPMWVQPIIFLIIGVLMIVLNLDTAIAEVTLREGA